LVLLPTESDARDYMVSGYRADLWRHEER
jgi:hypothetical protein